MAATMLAEHGEMEAAIRRLMRPVDEAAAQGVRPSPTWADKATLNQLYTYCMSLNRDDASLLVSCSFTAGPYLLALVAELAGHLFPPCLGMLQPES